MAKFNSDVNLKMFSDADYKMAGLVLQGLLSEEEHKKIGEDFIKANKGLKYDDENFIPYWKFCFDSISVSYCGMEEQSND